MVLKVNLDSKYVQILETLVSVRRTLDLANSFFEQGPSQSPSQLLVSKSSTAIRSSVCSKEPAGTPVGTDTECDDSPKCISWLNSAQQRSTVAHVVLHARALEILETTDDSPYGLGPTFEVPNILMQPWLQCIQDIIVLC